MKACVYILKDETGRFYIGATSNLVRRLKQHQFKVTRTTSRMKNPVLVLVQEYDSMTHARIIERKIKNLKRKDYIQKMVNDGYIKLTIKN